MNQNKKRVLQRRRRKLHIRRKVRGTSGKPRLSVFRSHQNIYCQLIDDSTGKTMASASTLSEHLKGELGKKGGNRAAASAVGKAMGEKARGLGVERIQFDRNGARYHGRVKALAEAAREAGLKF